METGYLPSDYSNMCNKSTEIKVDIDGFKQCYADLYHIAQNELRRQIRSGTIDTVALINESWLRIQGTKPHWENRRHFLASMTTTMRHVLIDYARKRNAQRRGGDWMQITSSMLDQIEDCQNPIDLLVLDDALQQLGKRSARQEKLLELRLFGNLTVEEMADALEISTATVVRDLRMATAFVQQLLQ